MKHETSMYLVKSFETVVRVTLWNVEASSPEEAREKFNQGEREYIEDWDKDLLDSGILSVEEA
jgi:hypothetical protein